LPARARPVRPPVHGVDEDPPVPEPEAPEKVRRDADSVLVRRSELPRPRVVRGLIVRRVLVEPHVVPKRPKPEEVVRGLPQVPAERVADDVTGEDEARHQCAFGRSSMSTSPCRRQPMHASRVRGSEVGCRPDRWAAGAMRWMWSRWTEDSITRK